MESLIGELHQHENVPEWSKSRPCSIGYLPDISLPFVLEDYVGDDRPLDFTKAVQKFLSLTVDDRASATPYVYENYTEVLEAIGPAQVGPLIESPDEVWSHVHPTEVFVSRRWSDGKVYVRLFCECEWEPEHGLQIVFCDGDELCRVSAQDGHLTYADAYGLSDDEDRIGG